MHDDPSIVWPHVEASDREVVPRWDAASGAVVTPAEGWAESLPSAAYESVGRATGPALPARLTEPGFASLLHNVLVWNEAHVALLQGRLAYDRGAPTPSEEVAVRLTAAAIRSLPGGASSEVQAFLRDYLDTIGIPADASTPRTGRDAWARRGGEAKPAWDRLEAHLVFLARALSSGQGDLAGAIETEVVPRWLRSLEGTVAGARGMKVTTVDLPGNPPTSIASDPDGGLYVLRDGNVEAIDTRGRRRLLVSRDVTPTTPTRIGFHPEGGIFLLGPGEMLVIRMPEGAIRRLAGFPWPAKSRPASLLALADGPAVAVGSRIYRLDLASGEWTSLEAGGPVTGLAISDGDLLFTRSDTHRVHRLEDGRAVPVVGGEIAGLQDGPDGRLSSPQGLASLEDGSVVIADSGNHAVRRLDRPTRLVTISGGGAGRWDGPTEDALFYTPFAVTGRAGALAVLERGFPGVRVIASTEGEGFRLPAWTDALREPSEVYADIDSGLAALRKNDPEGALADFRKALEGCALDGNRIRAMEGAAEAHALLGQWAESLALAIGVTNLEPDDVEANIVRARAHLQVGQETEAREILYPIVERYLRGPSEPRLRDDRYAEAWQVIALADARREDWDGALKAGDEAVKAKELAARLYGKEWTEADAGAYVTRGSVRLRKGDAEDALADFARACEIAPRNPAALAGRGAALEATGQPDEAAVVHKQALQYDARNPEAHIGLARLYSKHLDDPDKALHHLERYLENGGDEAQAGEILSNLTALDKDRRGAYAETLIIGEDGERYRVRIYQDGTRTKTPEPWKKGE